MSVHAPPAIVVYSATIQLRKCLQATVQSATMLFLAAA